MTRLAFLDTETTGLDPDRHEVYEIGLILDDGDDQPQEWRWWLPVDPAKADPTALRIGRYYQRLSNTTSLPSQHVTTWYPEKHDDPLGGKKITEFAYDLARKLDGRHLIGAVPSFDAAFLERFLRRHGQAPTWHYHLVDVEALAAGHAQVEPPWNSDDLSSWVGVDPERFDRHTALGDARWARAIYRAVIYPQPETE